MSLAAHSLAAGRIERSLAGLARSNNNAWPTLVECCLTPSARHFTTTGCSKLIDHANHHSDSEQQFSNLLVPCISMAQDYLQTVNASRIPRDHGDPKAARAQQES